MKINLDFSKKNIQVENITFLKLKDFVELNNLQDWTIQDKDIVKVNYEIKTPLHNSTSVTHNNNNLTTPEFNPKNYSKANNS